MMRRVLAGVAGALLLGACNHGDTGYVELKMVPASQTKDLRLLVSIPRRSTRRAP